MRDHPYHGTVILAGMFGMKFKNDPNQRKEMEKIFDKILDGAQTWRDKGLDQLLLR